MPGYRSSHIEHMLKVLMSCSILFCSVKRRCHAQNRSPVTVKVRKLGRRPYNRGRRGGVWNGVSPKIFFLASPL